MILSYLSPVCRLLVAVAVLFMVPVGAAPPIIEDRSVVVGDGYASNYSPAPVAAVPGTQSSGRLVDVLTRLQQLQQETQYLRGEIEDQAHAVEGLRKRQREIYIDIDRRLERLESGSSASTATSTSPAVVEQGEELGVPSGESRKDEQWAYDKAFALLKEGRYAKSRQAFKAFLARYPDARYAANAQYWMAETSYVDRDFVAALAAFQKVPDQYPQSGKVPDSLVKIGYIHSEQSAWADARRVLGEVMTRYPTTSAARLADAHLKKMTRQGH